MIEPSLKRKILDGEELIYICERHFADEDIERTKTGQKALRLEAVPTKNQQSHKTNHQRHSLIGTERYRAVVYFKFHMFHQKKILIQEVKFVYIYFHHILTFPFTCLSSQFVWYTYFILVLLFLLDFTFYSEIMSCGTAELLDDSFILETLHNVNVII